MFSGVNFPVKIEIQKSVSEFARRYGMPDVGAGACVLPPPPALARQAARPARPARPRQPPPATDGHGRTRTRQATATE